MEKGNIKWTDARIGDSALVTSENKMGVILKDYGRKFHLRFVDGSEKTYDASELIFFNTDNDYKRGGSIKKGDTWEWHTVEYDSKKGNNYKVVKNIEITDIDSKGQVIGRVVGTSNQFIIRDPQKNLKSKVSKMETGGDIERGGAHMYIELKDSDIVVYHGDAFKIYKNAKPMFVISGAKKGSWDELWQSIRSIQSSNTDGQKGSAHIYVKLSNGDITVYHGDNVRQFRKLDEDERLFLQKNVRKDSWDRVYNTLMNLKSVKMENGGMAGKTHFQPVIRKDKNNPNFLYIDIYYPEGKGILSIGQSKTMFGREREEGALKALQIANSFAKQLEAKYNIEDIEVNDLKNGKVQVFAVSDDFVKMRDNLLNNIKMEDGGMVGQEIVFDDNGERNTGVIKEIHEITGNYIVATDDGRTVLAQKDLDVISLGKIKAKQQEAKKRFSFFDDGGLIDKIKVGTFVRYKKDNDFTGGKVISLSVDNAKINNWDGSIIELPIKDLEYVKSWNESKFKEGGSIEKENKEMIDSQTIEARHHVEELSKILTKKNKIEPWVVAKMERATTDLSDVTHYLEGKKMVYGGGVSDLGGVGDLKGMKMLYKIPRNPKVTNAYEKFKEYMLILNKGKSKYSSIMPYINMNGVVIRYKDENGNNTSLITYMPVLELFTRKGSISPKVRNLLPKEVKSDLNSYTTNYFLDSDHLELADHIKIINSEGELIKEFKNRSKKLAGGGGLEEDKTFDSFKEFKAFNKKAWDSLIDVWEDASRTSRESARKDLNENVGWTYQIKLMNGKIYFQNIDSLETFEYNESDQYWDDINYEKVGKFTLFAQGGMTQHGLKRGDTIVYNSGNEVMVVDKNKNQKLVDLDKGERLMKGGLMSGWKHKMKTGGGVEKRNETQENNFGVTYKLDDKFTLQKQMGNNKSQDVSIIEILPSGLFFKVDKSNNLFSIKTLRSKGSSYTSGEYLVPTKNKYEVGGNVKAYQLTGAYGSKGIAGKVLFEFKKEVEKLNLPLDLNKALNEINTLWNKWSISEGAKIIENEVVKVVKNTSDIEFITATLNQFKWEADTVNNLNNQGIKNKLWIRIPGDFVINVGFNNVDASNFSKKLGGMKNDPININQTDVLGKYKNVGRNNVEIRESLFLLLEVVKGKKKFDGGAVKHSKMSTGGAVKKNGVNQFAEDEKSEGYQAKVFLGKFDDRTFKAQSTDKIWDDGTPVTKYFSRNGFKDVKLKGEYQLVDSDRGWWYIQGPRDVWYAVRHKDYGTPPFEFGKGGMMPGWKHKDKK
jgi:hypothetical protein